MDIRFIFVFCIHSACIPTIFLLKIKYFLLCINNDYPFCLSEYLFTLCFKINNMCYTYLYEQMDKHAKDGMLWLMLLDIDAFKSINDTYGHIEGDTALKKTAHVLQAVCNQHNCFLARYGGDEFVLAAITADPGFMEQLEQHIADSLPGAAASLYTQVQLRLGCLSAGFFPAAVHRRCRPGNVQKKPYHRILKRTH